MSPAAARRRIVVGVGGASGAIYAARLLDHLQTRDDVDVELIFTRTGRLIWHDEVGTDPARYPFRVHNHHDLAAPPASGSARYDAMIVVPCSAAGLSRIAHGISDDLVGRAADVMLKERKPLVLVLRESPYSLVLLRNMTAVAEAGAVIVPASPSFYSFPTLSPPGRPAGGPPSVEALVDTVLCRVLDQIGVENDLMRRWTGRAPSGGAAS